MTQKLRAYQQRGLDSIRAELSAGRKGVLAVAPTGAGKGTMISHLAAETALAGLRALVVAHRREIVLDILERTRELYAWTAAVLPGERPDKNARIQVASTASVLAGDIPKADILIVDEAHHYVADEWGELLRQTGNVPRVGFTATPQRADGRPMGDVFESLVDVVSYSRLLKSGLIVPCDVLRPNSYLGMDIAQDPVDAYLKHAAGSVCFIFSRDVASAQRSVSRLRAQGVPAAVIHANTSTSNRDRHLADLRAGTLRVIANAYTMTEGVDAPNVSTVVLERHCTHWGTYVQTTGRCLRSYPGKSRALLIDLHGVSHLPTHGMPTQDREYSLTGACGLKTAEREPAEREYTEPRDPVVLGVDLVPVVSQHASLPPPEDVVAKPTSRSNDTPAAFWARLMADVKRRVITMENAMAAYDAQFGKRVRSRR